LDKTMSQDGRRVASPSGPASHAALSQAAAVGVAVAVLSFLALTLAKGPGHACAIWPANAVVLAFVLRHPRRWIGLMVAGLIGALAADQITGDAPVLGIGMAMLNSAEILAAAALQRLTGPELDLSRFRHLLVFASVATTASAASAVGAALLLKIVDGLDYGQSFQVWFIGDALGLMIVTPALLSLDVRGRAWLAAPNRLRRMALVLLPPAVTVVAFLQPQWRGGFFVFSAFILVAFQAQTVGVALALLASVLISTILSAMGYGPAAAEGGHGALMLQIFMLACAATSFPVAAAISRRNVLEASLAATARDFQLLAAEAEAAATAKSEFLSNMSHEIRTPLTAIIGFSQLLQAGEELPPSAQTYSDRIATAGQALLTVVNDILDFSKIEAGHVELDPLPFDPAELVAEAVDLVSAQAAAKSLFVQAEALGPLPAAVNADRSRLRQVLLNLLSNAIKFTERGGVNVAVSYEAVGEGRLRIAVTDTGIGLDPAQCGKLFQRFSQADGSISRRHGGTGLGLAICKSLAELMGGDIGVISEPGQGSSFWFTVAAPLATLAPAAAPEPEQTLTMRPAYVLVVDDVAANRELVRALLTALDHRVAEAASGAEAVEQSLRTRFDLILMDLQMPGMDGLAATRAIRAASSANATAPILALSANVTEQHIEACLQAGMDDHIGKPINPGELLAKVAYWTAEQQAEPAAEAAA
jgi:signal transduction histidine kinase/CheY-like chemotaxis protein